MSQSSCAINTCKRTSCALCNCCQKKLCIVHLNEHNDSLNSQLYPLTDEINALGQRLKTFQVQEIVGDCHQKLEQWRLDCHQKIDYFFQQKYQELDRLVAEKVNKQWKNINDIQLKVAELIRDQKLMRHRQDIDTLTSTIRHLEKEMNKIEQTHFQVNTQPLLIDDSRVQFKEAYAQELDPSTFSSVYKTTVYPKGSQHALASNDRLLLTHQTPNLCFLNTELTRVKEVLWSYGLIRDICWSSTLNRFIVITKDNILLVDENTMSIDKVKTIENQQWFSCTCFNDQLFLSTNVWGSSIVEIRLSSSIAVIKEWKPPKTCIMEECIDDIVYNNGALAVLIRSKAEKSIRMELRSCKSLDRLWSLVLNVVYNSDLAFRCCSLDRKGWLVVDCNAERLLHITTDGKMKQKIKYKGNPYRLTLFTPDLLAIETEKNINIHKI